MDMKIFNVLLVGCFIVFASCGYGLPDRESSPSDTADKAGKTGSSGTQAGGSGGQSGGGDDAAVDDTGQGGAGEEPGCPEGFRCTAPGGAFVCTDPDTYIPPTCATDADCSFGTCTDYEGDKYCVKECGPEVDSCPEASVCNTLFDGANVCAQSIVWSAPPCQTQDDCPFGECMRSYYGQKLCVQPCESTKVKECPQQAACIPLEGRFFCANPSTGAPDTCTTDADCDYGVCVPYYGESYCTLECEPQLVDECPDTSACRFLAPLASYCSDTQTHLPPVCETDADCDYGTCVRYGDHSNCTEYCSQPGSEILGIVLGRDGVPIEGVDVCTFNEQGPEDICSVSDQYGQFAIIGLEAEMPYFFISMIKEGYQSTLQLAYANLLNTGLMFTDEEMEASAAEFDLEYPADDAGQIAFLAYSTVSVEGYKVEMLMQEGEGPFYADESNALDGSLEEASKSGWGSYFNVPAGTYYLDFTGAGDVVCGDIPAVIVVSGYLTYVVTYCDEWEM